MIPIVISTTYPPRACPVVTGIDRTEPRIKTVSHEIMDTTPEANAILLIMRNRTETKRWLGPNAIFFK